MKQQASRTSRIKSATRRSRRRAQLPARYGPLRRSGRLRLHRRCRRSTLLALVQEVQRHVENDADVVRLVRWMVNHHVVVLSGNFAGQRIR